MQEIVFFDREAELGDHENFPLFTRWLMKAGLSLADSVYSSSSERRRKDLMVQHLEQAFTEHGAFEEVLSEGQCYRLANSRDYSIRNLDEQDLIAIEQYAV